MARSLEIPAIVGSKDITSRVVDGDEIIVDGLEGQVFIKPDADTINTYSVKAEEFENQKAEWEKLKEEDTVTADGKHIELAANIGTPKD